MNERQGRQQAVAQERRRRSDDSIDAESRSKLAIPEEIKARLAAEGKVPRWANDDKNRIHNLTVKDDYDKVDGVEPVPVGTSKEGKPVMAHLLAKRADFIAEDREKREITRRETEAGMMKGAVPGSSIPGQTYADKANSLGRGTQTIE